MVCLGPVAAYAVQRFFFHASLYFIVPAFFVAISSLLDHNYVWASVSAGVSVACLLYRSAFRKSTDRHLRREFLGSRLGRAMRRRPTAIPPKSSPEAK